MLLTPLQFDKPRNLRFDIQACLDLEDALGRPLGTIVAQLANCSITATCAAIWAGCKHEDESLTIKAVAKRLEKHLEGGGNMKSINDALNAALLQSTPLRNKQESPDEDAEGNAQPEPAVAG